MRLRKESFIEYCPICWERMERQGALNGKAFYICPICGMATDGRHDDAGAGKQIHGDKHPI